MQEFSAVDILGYGAIGLGFLVAFMAYRLLQQALKQENPNKQTVRAIRLFMGFAIILTFIGLAKDLAPFAIQPQRQVKNLCIQSDIGETDYMLEVTTVSLAGEWNSVIILPSGQALPETSGKATITQLPGCPFFRIQGRVPRPDGVGYDEIYFTEIGFLEGRRMRIIYQHIAGDRGIGEAFLENDNPATFRLKFQDVEGTSADEFKTSEILFTRQ